MPVIVSVVGEILLWSAAASLLSSKPLSSGNGLTFICLEIAFVHLPTNSFWKGFYSSYWSAAFKSNKTIFTLHYWYIIAEAEEEKEGKPKAQQAHTQ